jgi:hypothetical protein
MVEACIYFSQQNGNAAVVPYAEQENPAALAENGHQS